MAEGARLESVYTETYRGFESLPHRQPNLIGNSLVYDRGFFVSNDFEVRVRTLELGSKLSDA